MAKSKKEAGQEYLKNVLALIPEAQRASIQEALSVETAIEALGSPFVEVETAAEARIAQAAQKEQQVLGYKQNLDKWYANTQTTFGKQQTELEEKIKKAALVTPGDGSTPAIPPDVVTKADLTKQVQEIVTASERNGMGAIGYFTTLANKHYDTFKEPLDVMQLVQNATQAGKTVPQYYQELVAPKLAEIEKKRATDHDAQIRKDEREKILAESRKQEGHRAYPLPGLGAEDPSTLGGLEKSNGKDANPDFGVKAALDHYYAKGSNI